MIDRLKRHVIRPLSSDGLDLIIEAASPYTAATEFGRTIGLITTDLAEDHDAIGRPFVKFLLGTGTRFVAYEEPTDV